MKRILFFSLMLISTALIAYTVCYTFSPLLPMDLLSPLRLTAPEGISLALTVTAIDSTRARAAYERISFISQECSKLFGAKIGGDIIVNRDVIITEQVINNNNGAYTFDLSNKTLQNQTPKRPLVKGVIDNDLFMPMNVRLLIDSRVQGSANVKVQTYPNPLEFDPSGATVLDLYAIFNAQWSFQVDRVVYINGDTTRKFLKVPKWNTETSTGVGTFSNAFDGIRYYELDPYPIISGRLDNKLTLNVSYITGWNGAADTEEYSTLENVITFEFDGYTIKNAHKLIQFFNGNLKIDSAADVENFDC